MLTTGTIVLIVMSIKFGPTLCVMGEGTKNLWQCDEHGLLGDFTVELGGPPCLL